MKNTSGNTITLRLGILFLLVTLISCATYNSQSLAFQSKLQQGNTKGALASLEKNKFLSKPRNKLLSLLEKGRVAYLDGDYKLSNTYFNQADLFIEENKAAVGNQILGTLINPEKTTYKGEDFEKVAIHYYKALNYTFLNQYDEALVEAKRITLQLQKINEAYPKNKKNRYKSDAFALNLQGLLYEASGDINNAFIAYRNAVDLYLKYEGAYIGVPIPQQLQHDVLRTASIMGFQNSVVAYEKKLGIKYQENIKEDHLGEVVIFWENGLVPYKDETFFTFTILPNTGIGYATIVNKDLAIDLPFPAFGNKKNTLDVFNVAFPRYVARQPYYQKALIINAGKSYDFQLAQNYDEIAFKTLKDRTLREIGNTALRIGAKKISQYSLQEKNEGLGVVLGLVNAFTESADTRNWQTLPSKIYYSRIPLKKGDNVMQLQLQSSSENENKTEIKVSGKKGLQFRKVSTLKVYQ